MPDIAKNFGFKQRTAKKIARERRISYFELSVPFCVKNLYSSFVALRSIGAQKHSYRPSADYVTFGENNLSAIEITFTGYKEVQILELMGYTLCLGSNQSAKLPAPNVETT